MRLVPAGIWWHKSFGDLSYSKTEDREAGGGNAGKEEQCFLGYVR